MKENTAKIGDGHDRSGNESFPCRWSEIKKIYANLAQVFGERSDYFGKAPFRFAFKIHRSRICLFECNPFRDPNLLDNHKFKIILFLIIKDLNNEESEITLLRLSISRIFDLEHLLVSRTKQLVP